MMIWDCVRKVPSGRKNPRPGDHDVGIRYEETASGPKLREDKNARREKGGELASVRE